MVDRYTKIVLTLIAVALMGLLMRALLDVRAVNAQQSAACGAAETPCLVTIVGGPGDVGGWRGVPLLVIDSQRIVPRRSP